jgi:periplasmic mercuric ion binding protein
VKIYKLLLSVIFMVAINSTASSQHNHSGGNGGSGRNMNMNMGANTHLSKPSPKKEVIEVWETIKVWGKCELCKTRIENKALKSGAITADWNIKSKFLTVSYDPTKTNLDYISGKLAKAGHDTGLESAKIKAYNSLPECCKYERIRDSF